MAHSLVVPTIAASGGTLPGERTKSDLLLPAAAAYSQPAYLAIDGRTGAGLQEN